MPQLFAMDLTEPPIPFELSFRYQVAVEHEYDHAAALLKPVLSDSALAEDWQRLEAKANVAYFLSWAYIKHVLQSYWLDAKSYEDLQQKGLRLYACRVYRGKNLCAIALLSAEGVSYSSQQEELVTKGEGATQSRDRELAALHSWQRTVNTAYLNEVGDGDRDKIYIEYNQFVSDPGLDCRQLYPALLKELASVFPNLRKTVFSGVNVSVKDAIAAYANSACFCRYQSACYRADLQDEDDVSQLVSRNRRNKIRQSIKHLGGEDLVKLHRIAQGDELNLAFDQLASLHKARWGKESGFHKHEFVRFHKSLLSQSLSTGIDPSSFVATLFSLKTAAQKPSFLYLIFYKKTCYFYLSALADGGDNKYRPGWVAHFLALDLAKKLGYRYYDFMGGDADYKRSFTQASKQPQSAIAHLEVYHGWSFARLKHQLRLARNRLRASIQ